MQREARRASEADATVAELQEKVQELEIRRAEQADQLASWDGFETVVDLMAWEEKVGAVTKAALPPEAAGLTSSSSKTTLPMLMGRVVVRLGT